MKRFSQLIIFILVSVFIFHSCSKDEWREVVNPPGNKAPIANAGVDQEIYLPLDSIRLDGSASKDPDGTIKTYSWTKVGGPASGRMTSPTNMVTMVKELTEGEYSFALTVYDDKGALNTDYVRIDVRPKITSDCNISGRPLINANQIFIGKLSVARTPYVASAGNVIVFAGGIVFENNYYNTSDAVDIYDINTRLWTTSKLSSGREGIAAIGCGNKVFFAGGGFFDVASDRVDIYDVVTKTWTLAHLSEPRMFLTAATIGDKVIFAGGFNNEYSASMNVDIYDISEDSWTTSLLSEGRMEMGAVTLGQKVYFAGGNTLYQNSKKIDVYDAANNTWSQTYLNEISGPVSGVVHNNNIYWSGIDQTRNQGKVEIMNPSIGSASFGCLSYSRKSPTAVSVRNDIAFFTYVDYNNMQLPLSDKFDIYNSLTNEWSIGRLLQAVTAPAIISVGNKIYMGGGQISNLDCTDDVYILNW